MRRLRSALHAGAVLLNGLMLHFAYGSNMSIALMRRRCPNAVALGRAQLTGWRYMITRDGYASVTPRPGAQVHGVLWRLRPRDLAALNAYESLDAGLYRRRTLTVVHHRRRVAALTYLGRAHGDGKPKPGYQAIVVAAACQWKLPDRYIRALRRWAPAGHSGSRPAETGEMG